MKKSIVQIWRCAHLDSLIQRTTYPCGGESTKCLSRYSTMRKEDETLHVRQMCESAFTSGEKCPA